MKKEKTKTSTAETVFMKSLIKASGNDEASLMSEETLSTTTDWIDTGSYALNGVISGDIFKGIANNKVIVWAGKKSCGKTYLCLSITKSAIKKGYIIAYFDSENTTEKEMLVKRDMDPEKFMYFPVDTVENFRNQALKIVNSYNENKDPDKPKMLFVLDSLGNLSTNKEIRDAEEGKETRDMTRAQFIKSIFRVLNLKLAKAKIPMLITNHVYDTMSFIPGTTQSGGSGALYAGSIIVEMTKSKAKDKDGNVTGAYLRCKTTKNRFCKEDSVISVYLDYKRGLHPFYGLQEFGDPMLVKASKGWTLNGEVISEKQLWSKPWSDELLKIANKNINTKFAYGSNESDAELTSEVEEREEE